MLTHFATRATFVADKFCVVATKMFFKHLLCPRGAQRCLHISHDAPRAWAVTQETLPHPTQSFLHSLEKRDLNYMGESLAGRCHTSKILQQKTKNFMIRVIIRIKIMLRMFVSRWSMNLDPAPSQNNLRARATPRNISTALPVRKAGKRVDTSHEYWTFLFSSVQEIAKV